MTVNYQNFDGSVALDVVQSVQGALGTGVLSGCAPSLPSSTSPITIDVASGTVVIANTEVSVSAGSVTLPDGDAQHPRKDVVYADSAGDLQSLQGTPRPPKDGTGSPGTDRSGHQPEPPDLSSLSSVADAAIIAEIWVPAGATATSDMTDSGVAYVRDRRLRPYAASVLTTSDEGPGGGLDADTVDGEDASAFADATHAAQHQDGGGDELDVASLAGGGGTAGQVPQTDGAAVAWIDLPHGDLSGVSAADHHARYTDEEAQDAVGGTYTDGLAYDDASNESGLDVIASGSVTLSSGAATIDTGVATTTTATFSVFLGPATDDANLAAEVRSDSGSNNYEINLVETDTSVGNPLVEYDVVRLR
jgi:hypothetical protein